MTLLRLAAISALTLAVLPLSAQDLQINKDNKTISITATDDASALADTAVVSIGFNSYGKDQDSIYADATKTSNAIISAISAAGVPRDAIHSQDQSLTQLYMNNDQERALYAQGMRFQFSQGWQITVPANQAAQLLQLAITNGANNSGNIQWQLANDEALQTAAAQKALHHARDLAEHMTQGLGTKLGALLYASNQTPVVNNLGRMRGYGIGTGTGGGIGGGVFGGRNLKPLAISPDRITRSATVYAVFSIE